MSGHIPQRGEHYILRRANAVIHIVWEYRGGYHAIVAYCGKWLWADEVRSATTERDCKKCLARMDAETER